MMKNPKTKSLEALGVSAATNEGMYKFDGPDSKVLEAIPYDNDGVDVSLTYSAWTGLCPVTGQPDHGTIVIDYEPDRHIVETKSLKLYMMRFRNYGCFGESVVARIRDDLAKVLRPKKLTVEGIFASRGDVAINPVAKYKKKQ